MIVYIYVTLAYKLGLKNTKQFIDLPTLKLI